MSMNVCRTMVDALSIVRIQKALLPVHAQSLVMNSKQMDVPVKVSLEWQIYCFVVKVTVWLQQLFGSR